MPGFTGFVAILFSFNCQRRDFMKRPGNCQDKKAGAGKTIDGIEYQMFMKTDL